jgi:adenine deaminase
LKTLVDVCMGRTPADLVITGGRLVNVHTREVHDGVELAIKDGRVATFGEAGHTRGPETEVIEADGAYLVPGLIDTHLHVESAMVTVTRFAEAVLPHGTTTVVIDNHEMANVFGLEGIRWMLDEAAPLPLRVLLAVPSCVPALPGLEDAGAAFGPAEIEEALRWRQTAALGEMMNMPGVGHLNRGVRVAIEAGLDPLVAIQLATVNAAEYLGLRHELGSLAPGRWADVLLVDDLLELRPRLVLTAGKPVGELPRFEYPRRAYESVRIPELGPHSFRVSATGPTAAVRAIGMVSGVLATEHRIVEAPVHAGEVRASAELDLAKAASIERHGGPGTIGLGFVQGLGLERGAVATTVAHDNHNLLVIGMNDRDMLFACERVRTAGGGMIAVADGDVLAFVELPIAGLVSDRPVHELAAQVRALGEAYRRLGSSLESPFMFVSLLSLGVIPALRLTNRGLVDGIAFELLPPVVERNHWRE